MGIKEFIEKFAEIFDDTDAATLTPATNFKEIDEWSSLSVLGLIALADEEFDFELTSNDLRGVSTIEELYNLVSKK